MNNNGRCFRPNPSVEEGEQFPMNPDELLQWCQPLLTPSQRAAFASIAWVPGGDMIELAQLFRIERTDSPDGAPVSCSDDVSAWYRPLITATEELALDPNPALRMLAFWTSLLDEEGLASLVCSERDPAVLDVIPFMPCCNVLRILKLVGWHNTSHTPVVRAILGNVDLIFAKAEPGMEVARAVTFAHTLCDIATDNLAAAERYTDAILATLWSRLGKARALGGSVDASVALAAFAETVAWGCPNHPMGMRCIDALKDLRKLGDLFANARNGTKASDKTALSGVSHVR